jgi:hypothetical protein
MARRQKSKLGARALMEEGDTWICGARALAISRAIRLPSVFNLGLVLCLFPD